MELTAPFLTNFWPYIAVGSLAFAIWFLITRLAKTGSKQVTSANESEARAMRGDQDGYVFRDSDTTEWSTSAGEADVGVASYSEKHGTHVPFKPERLTVEVMRQRSKSFYEAMNERRSCRFFSTEGVPREVVDYIIRTAGTSPSGAHTQPWTYVVVSNRSVKSKIREIIEAEERVNYTKRMGQQWVDDLGPLNVDWNKPYLEHAPYLIVVFKQVYGLQESTGARVTHYYNELSVCLSVGLLLAAIQNAGLVSVTTTPMNAGPQLRVLLNRPVNEKVIFVLPLGYAAETATVPQLSRNPLSKIMSFI